MNDARYSLRVGLLIAACAVLSAANRGTALEPPPLPTAGDAKPAAASDADETRAALQRRAARRLHFAERDQRRSLAIAERELNAGRTIAGLRLLQQLINLNDDRFTLSADGIRVSGLRQRAAERLERLGDAQRQTYERLFNPPARRLVEQAARYGDREILHDVLRRYRHTTAGLEAANRLAVAAFDRGDYGRAAGLWESIADMPVHRKRLTATMRLRYAVALHRSGDERKAQRVLREIRGTQFRIGGRLTTAGRYFERELHMASSRIANREVTPPFLRPVWTLGYTAKSSAASLAANAWRETQLARGDSEAIVSRPLVIGRQLLYRDYDGIRAVVVTSGRTAWFHETRTTLSARLEAASVDRPTQFDTTFARNERLSALSTDGRRVYFLDDEQQIVGEVPHRRSPFGRRLMRVEATESPWNRLQAIELLHRRHLSRRESTRLAWSLGGSAKEKSSKNPFGGHFFHGPPLAKIGRLFVVSERARVLRLFCLNPADGRIVWSQPLANNAQRVKHRSPAIRLVYADGLLVCATPAGFLIAIDAVTGSLRWASPFREETDDELDVVRFASSPRSHSGFVSQPVVRDGRVLYLPADGADLHCFALKTGRQLWQAPREECLSIATVNANTVVAVGRRATRGLNVTDGRVRWRTATGHPTGRGLATKSHLLLPTDAGRILAIDVRTGRMIGLGLPGLIEQKTADRDGDNWKPGNLISTGELILSIEHDRIRAFPQSGPLFARLRKSLDNPTLSPALSQRAAELALLLGQSHTADRLLSRVVKTAKTDDRRQRAGRLLRELLYRRLKDGDGEAAKIVERLDGMSKETQARVRFLMAKSEWHLRTVDHGRVLRTIDEFAGLRADGLFPAPNDAGRLVSLAAWSAEVLQQIDRHDRAKLQAHVSARRDAALKQPGVEPLERFLTLFGSRIEAEPARNELARRLIDRHDDQRAELLLLRNRQSRDARIAAAASRLLGDLWVQHKLYEQAAKLLGGLDDKAHHPALRSRALFRGAKGDESNRLLSTAEQRLAGPRTPVRRVDVQPVAGATIDPELQRLYSNFRQVFPVPADSPFELLDLGDGSRTELTIVDRATGVETGRIAIPTRHSFAPQSGHAHVGGYLSLGSFGQMHGVSLLERDRGRPFWSTKPFGLSGRSDMLHTGPANAGYALFQAQEHLIAVDPGTGQILWQRSDLPPAAGLVGDPYAGIFGDERALVVLRDSEERNRRFIVYDPSTGARLRNGRLSMPEDSTRRTVGRILLHTAIVNGKSRLRIWDPLEEQPRLDLPLPRGLFSTEVDARRSLILTGDGVLRIVDVPTAGVRTLHIFDVTEMARLNYIKAFAQDGKLFVNLQRPTRVRDTHFSFYLGDAMLPVEHIRGELYAIDLKTGRQLWKQTLPQRSVLKPRRGRLPVLILASRIRDRRRGTRTGLLIEVLDTTTGETLGRRDDLYPDRLLRMSYDPAAKTIRLRGLKTAIRLRLYARPIADEPNL